MELETVNKTEIKKRGMRASPLQKTNREFINSNVQIVMAFTSVKAAEIKRSDIQSIIDHTGYNKQTPLIFLPENTTILLLQPLSY